MQKITKILEKNVQWIGLALGAAFLMWMVYGYIIKPPIVSTVAGVALTPGEIDEKIKNGPVTRLQTAMARVDAPKIAEIDFVSPLAKELTQPPQAVALDGPWSGIPLPPTGAIEQPKIQGPGIAQVTKLPEAPPPVDLKFSQGRSNVLVPTSPSAAATGGPPTGTPADKNWVTVAATIQMKPLADSYDKQKIPPELAANTTLLHVDLVREEQDSNGNWGPETTIGPIPTSDLQPMPAESAGPAVQQTYVEWAEKNQVPLLQPPFYQVLQADPWYMPGQPPPLAAAVAVDPNAPVDPAKAAELAKEEAAKQKADAEVARKQALRDAAKARQQQPHAPAARPGGGYPPPENDVMDTGRPTELAQAGPYSQPHGPGPYGGPPPFGGGPPPYGGTPPYALPQPSVQPGSPPIGPAPVGSFDPHPPQTDVTIWAHDDTVQPGHTYHYKLVYTISNPIRSSQGVATDPKLTNQFLIASKPSDWTAPISVKAETNFFVKDISPGKEQVKFEIFRWKNGAWQSQDFTATPGDIVGSFKGTGASLVDFNTNLTLVGVRVDPMITENRIVILTGDNGQLVLHDENSDRNSEDYKKLKEQASKPAPPAGSPQAAATP